MRHGKGQESAFLNGEADRWFERNATVLQASDEDPVLQALAHLRLKPERVLEIGCANGYRLQALHEAYGAQCAGLDPSKQAVNDGRGKWPYLDLRVGTAEKLPYADERFDLVIFGFCLYLVDPVHLLAVVAEADRVLKDGGYLVIFDFLEPVPYSNEYVHRPGIRSHKMEFSRLFLAHPAYALLMRLPDMRHENPLERDQRQGVDVLVKNMAAAFRFSVR